MMKKKKEEREKERKGKREREIESKNKRRKAVPPASNQRSNGLRWLSVGQSCHVLSDSLSCSFAPHFSTHSFLSLLASVSPFLRPPHLLFFRYDVCAFGFFLFSAKKRLRYGAASWLLFPSTVHFAAYSLELRKRKKERKKERKNEKKEKERERRV